MKVILIFEADSLDDSEVVKIIKDRQKKDNHNMSEPFITLIKDGLSNSW